MATRKKEVKMTVKELAELLKKYPDDLRVIVNGYHWNEILEVKDGEKS